MNFKIPDKKKKKKLIVESKHLHLVIASKHKQERGWKKIFSSFVVIVFVFFVF